MEGKGRGTDACHSAGVRVSGGDFICVQDQYIYIYVCVYARASVSVVLRCYAASPFFSRPRCVALRFER